MLVDLKSLYIASKLKRSFTPNPILAQLLLKERQQILAAVAAIACLLLFQSSSTSSSRDQWSIYKNAANYRYKCIWHWKIATRRPFEFLWRIFSNETGKLQQKKHITAL